MASAMENKELDKLLHMSAEQLDVEANVTSTTKAQLKHNEKTFLEEREILKRELETAAVGDEQSSSRHTSKRWQYRSE